MPAPGPRTPRRLPEAVRRRLEVASATAWESLVEAHASHALRLIALLADRLPFDEAVTRYLREMEVSETMAAAVRNRVLVALEDAARPDDSRPSLQLFAAPREEEEPHEEGNAATRLAAGWRRFRPDVLMRGLKERHRRHDETEGWIRLAIARAEEGIISTHVDNAITFAALLDPHMPLERAIEEYNGALGLAGPRAQAVLQRAMARLAEARLPAAIPARASDPRPDPAP
ncbi:MAG TPA: hypothetical protein VF192_03805 [Longimicrobiales bacterium]